MPSLSIAEELAKKQREIYSYDADDRLTSSTDGSAYFYDADGNLRTDLCSRRISALAFAPYPTPRPEPLPPREYSRIDR